MFDFLNDKVSEPHKKLLQLADYLETVKDKYFDLVDIGHGPTKKELERRSCGTVLCACGYTTKLWPRYFIIEVERNQWPDGDYDKYILYVNLKSNPELSGLDPFAVFFDISSEEADFLFLDSEYDDPSRKNVINRIRNLVALKTLGADDPIRMINKA